MKLRSWILAVAFATIQLTAAWPAEITEEKALAIVKSLPEFTALMQRYKGAEGDISIDGPFSVTPESEDRGRLGQNAWHVDVYVIVHDDAEIGHGWPWAFFRVSSSGEVFVKDFDFDRGDFVLRSLAEWRRARNDPERSPSDHPKGAAARRPPSGPSSPPGVPLH